MLSPAVVVPSFFGRSDVSTLVTKVPCASSLVLAMLKKGQTKTNIGQLKKGVDVVISVLSLTSVYEHGSVIVFRTVNSRFPTRGNNQSKPGNNINFGVRKRGRLRVMFAHPGKVMNEASGERTGQGKSGVKQGNESRRTVLEDTREKHEPPDPGLRLKVSALG